MKRIVIVVLLVALAAVAGIVARSAATRHELRELVSQEEQSDVRKEIREKYELAPGAQVELFGLNGFVKIETSDTRTAEVYVERMGSEEALKRRQINIEATGNRLTIKSEKHESGFFSRFFGSEAHENVTLPMYGLGRRGSGPCTQNPFPSGSRSTVKTSFNSPASDVFVSTSLAPRPMTRFTSASRSGTLTSR